MILRTAFKNIIGAGKLTWLNVSVLSFTMVVMVAYNGLLDGWMEEARTESKKWELGDGQFWHPDYDRYDLFTVQDAHGQAPEELAQYITEGSVTPILLTQASIYPQGRMINVMLKGIEKKQTLLAIPTNMLEGQSADDIPVIIGKRMAASAGLTEGDRVMLRWRDKNGVFDAREVVVAGIFDTKVPSVDGGQIWIDMDDLYEMTGMYGEATYYVKSPACTLAENAGGWSYQSLQTLTTDIDEMEKSAAIESAIIFVLLLSLALLAVFDTQTLSIFRRQREIGTYVALGMTPRKVTALFTLEGTLYSVLAVATGAIWGFPVLYWFGKYGFPLGDFQDMGVVMGDAMYPVYHVASIAKSLLIIITLSALISYLPARKITRQNIVYALKGKIG